MKVKTPLASGREVPLRAVPVEDTDLMGRIRRSSCRQGHLEVPHLPHGLAHGQEIEGPAAGILGVVEQRLHVGERLLGPIGPAVEPDQLPDRVLGLVLAVSDPSPLGAVRHPALPNRWRSVNQLVPARDATAPGGTRGAGGRGLPAPRGVLIRGRSRSGRGAASGWR